MKFSGYFFAILGVFLYAISDGIMKFFVQIYGVNQIAFLRTFFRFLPFCLLALCLKVNPLKTHRIGENILRAILATCATYGFIAAYKFSSMTDVILIAYTSAIFVLPFSSLILREKFTIHNACAVALGFIGVILIFYRSTVASNFIFQSNSKQIGLIFALIAAISTAFNHVIIKRLSFIDNELTIIFYHHLCLLIVSIIFGIADFNEISLLHLSALFFGGLLGAIAQYCTIHAYKLSKCVDLAPVAYLIFIPSALIDYLFYGKSFNLIDVLGAFCILGGCWCVIFKGQLLQKLRANS